MLLSCVQVAMEGGAAGGSLTDPTSPTNFTNPMYDSLHAQESIILSSGLPPVEESPPSPRHTSPAPKPPPRRDGVGAEQSPAGAGQGPELRIVPRALDPTDDDEHDTAGLVRQGSLWQSDCLVEL
jgi:hypothetical protein